MNQVNELVIKVGMHVLLIVEEVRLRRESLNKILDGRTHFLKNPIRLHLDLSSSIGGVN
jgi:hypothetical protein